MAAIVSDHHLGRLMAFSDLPGNAALLMVLLKADGLQDHLEFSAHATVADVLAHSSEADFTNYSRKQITAVTVDRDPGRSAAVDVDTQVWTDAGGYGVGDVNNTLGKVVVAYDPDPATSTDADRLFLIAYDVVASTNGNDFIVRIHDDGLFRYVQ